MDATERLTSSEIWPPNVTHVPAKGIITDLVKHLRRFENYCQFQTCIDYHFDLDTAAQKSVH